MNTPTIDKANVEVFTMRALADVAAGCTGADAVRPHLRDAAPYVDHEG